MTIESIKIRTSHNHIAGTVHAYMKHHNPELIPEEYVDVTEHLAQFLPNYAELFNPETSITLVTTLNNRVTTLNPATDNGTQPVLTPNRSQISGIVTKTNNQYTLIHGNTHHNWLTQNGYILGTYILIAEETEPNPLTPQF